MAYSVNETSSFEVSKAQAQSFFSAVWRGSKKHCLNINYFCQTNFIIDVWQGPKHSFERADFLVTLFRVGFFTRSLLYGS